jgi:hypothetical protein
VFKAVLRSILPTVLVGLAAGMFPNLAAARLMRRWIDGNVRDPVMLVTITLIAISVTTLASLRPASRAACIDPMDVLRADQHTPLIRHVIALARFPERFARASDRYDQV